MMTNRETPAGDVDYDRAPVDYAAIRRPEPRLAEAIRAALGEVDSVLNVGAGSGSYEPTDCAVTAVEPSAAMRAARPAHLPRALDAAAESLPFDDQVFDAALATMTVHQWRDLDLGLAELRRVTRGPIVVLTSDPEVLGEFWLGRYAAAVLQAECGRMPAISRLTSALAGSVELRSLPVPANCTDGFVEAFYGRPEAFLDPRVRAAQSSWGFAAPREVEASVARLGAALRDGSWDQAFSALRTAPTYDGSMRLLIARP